MQNSFPASSQTISGALCFEEREFRWGKQVSVPPDQWRIETRAPGETSWTSPPDALLQLLAAAGHRVLNKSSSYLRWQVDRNDIFFRAYRAGSNWTIESQEWGGVQWHECDAWCLMNLAFGLGILAEPRQPVVSEQIQRIRLSTAHRLTDPSNSARKDGYQPRYTEYSMALHAG
jgi:hypothetical protein